jgi:hypothetical protein
MEFLARHSVDDVTEMLDEVLEAVGEGADAFASAAAREWLR